jgi:hypothetical protein
MSETVSKYVDIETVFFIPYETHSVYIHYFNINLYSVKNHIGGLMVSVLASSAIDRGFE